MASNVFGRLKSMSGKSRPSKLATTNQMTMCAATLEINGIRGFLRPHGKVNSTSETKVDSVSMSSYEQAACDEHLYSERTAAMVDSGHSDDTTAERTIFHEQHVQSGSGSSLETSKTNAEAMITMAAVASSLAKYPDDSLAKDTEYFRNVAAFNAQNYSQALTDGLSGYYVDINGKRYCPMIKLTADVTFAPVDEPAQVSPTIEIEDDENHICREGCKHYAISVHSDEDEIYESIEYDDPHFPNHHYVDLDSLFESDHDDTFISDDNTITDSESQDHEIREVSAFLCAGEAWTPTSLTHDCPALEIDYDDNSEIDPLSPTNFYKPEEYGPEISILSTSSHKRTHPDTFIVKPTYNSGESSDDEDGSVIFTKRIRLSREEEHESNAFRPEREVILLEGDEVLPDYDAEEEHYRKNYVGGADNLPEYESEGEHEPQNYNFSDAGDLPNYESEKESKRNNYNVGDADDLPDYESEEESEGNNYDVGDADAPRANHWKSEVVFLEADEELPEQPTTPRAPSVVSNVTEQHENYVKRTRHANVGILVNAIARRTNAEKSVSPGPIARANADIMVNAKPVATNKATVVSIPDSVIAAEFAERGWAGQYDSMPSYWRQPLKLNPNSSPNKIVLMGDRSHGKQVFRHMNCTEVPFMHNRDFGWDETRETPGSTIALELSYYDKREYLAAEIDNKPLEESRRREAFLECTMARHEGLAVGKWRYYEGTRNLEYYLDSNMCICWENCSCTRWCGRYADLKCPCSKHIVLL